MNSVICSVVRVDIIMDGRLLLVVGALVIILVGVGSFALAPKPEGMKSPVDNWDFDAHCSWPNPCSHYRIAYHFPTSTNTGSKGTYNVTFKVLDLAWTTTGIDLHRLNVTFQNPSGVQVYNYSFVANIHLAAGQAWGPKYGNFSFTDSRLGLAPAENVTLNASVSAEFDEVSVVLSNHFSKTETTSSIGVQIHSSTVPPPSAPNAGFAFSWASVGPWILLGSFVWVISAVAKTFMGLPRPTSFGSGFRNPSNGQFVSFGGAMIAFASVGITIFFWIMGNLGAPDHVIAYGELMFGSLTGNVPLSAALSVANYSVGTLLHLRS